MHFAKTDNTTSIVHILLTTCQLALIRVSVDYMPNICQHLFWFPPKDILMMFQTYRFGRSSWSEPRVRVSIEDSKPSLFTINY